MVQIDSLDVKARTSEMASYRLEQMKDGA